MPPAAAPRRAEKRVDRLVLLLVLGFLQPDYEDENEDEF